MRYDESAIDRMADEANAWRDRAVAVEARADRLVEALRETSDEHGLFTESGGSQWCEQCTTSFPCSTRKRADAALAAEVAPEQGLASNHPADGSYGGVGASEAIACRKCGGKRVVPIRGTSPLVGLDHPTHEPCPACGASRELPSNSLRSGRGSLEKEQTMDKDLRPSDHERRMEVMRDLATYELGSPEWADILIGAYLWPEATRALQESCMETDE